MPRPIAALAAGLLLTACALTPPEPRLPSDRAARDILTEELQKAAPPAPPIIARVPPARPEPEQATVDPLSAATVTLRGTEIPLGEALIRLARPTGLTLVIEPEVEGQTPVNLDLHDLPVRDALRAVLSPFGYAHRVEPREGRADLVVYAFETRVWALSLPPGESQWEQTIANQSTIAGGSQDPTTGILTTTTPGGAPAVQLGSKVSLTQKGEKLSFWDDVKTALQRMVSPKGWSAINRLAGTVTIRERPDRLAEIDRYFQSVEQEVARQVQVEVKVLEVALTSQDALGIDWEQVASGLLDSGKGKLSFSAQATSQLLTGTTLPLSLILKSGSDRLVIKALGQQGHVRTLSQPKVLISNNHAAVIQVGQVRSFIAALSTTVSGTGGLSQTSASLGSVQDGMILALTPRVYGQEVVMIVTPVLTRINQIRTITLSGDNKIEAPEFNNRALSTTVRVPAGGMAVLGGLINEEDRTHEAGLPWIRKIPVLGWLLFGFRDQRAARSEVVIMLTPTIISPAAMLPAPITRPPTDAPPKAGSPTAPPQKAL